MASELNFKAQDAEKEKKEKDLKKKSALGDQEELAVQPQERWRGRAACGREWERRSRSEETCPEGCPLGLEALLGACLWSERKKLLFCLLKRARVREREKNKETNLHAKLQLKQHKDDQLHLLARQTQVGTDGLGVNTSAQKKREEGEREEGKGNKTASKRHPCCSCASRPREVSRRCRTSKKEGKRGEKQ